MRRRELIAMLGSTAAMLPVLAHARPSEMPVVGFMHTAPDLVLSTVNTVRKGLAEQGFIEGQNVAIVSRAAPDQERLFALATELVAARVAVILATGGVAPALAAKKATSTIPIVFVSGNDPVKLGLVHNLARPEGNVTGINMLLNALGAKQLQLLREMVPDAERVGFLIDPRQPNAEIDQKNMLASAAQLGIEIDVAPAESFDQIDDAFAALADKHVKAVVIGASAVLTSHAEQIVALAARHAMATISTNRYFVDHGGLINYGTDIADAVRQGGVYAGRILKGAKPAELPVVQTDKFALVINLTTTKKLGLTIPPTLFARADEVIE